MRARTTTFLAAAALLAATALALPAASGAASLTGRYLVAFHHPSQARSSVAGGAIARAGAHSDGPGVPKLGIATIDGPHAAISALRRDPSVAEVAPEWRRDLRVLPNDPALSSPETRSGTPAGVPMQWTLQRQGFPAAWDVTTGDNAIVGVIDTGVDGSHPELAAKIASAVSFGTDLGDPGPLTDQDGHGTHVSGLACAATNDGVATAGAGFNCKIAIAKAPNLRDEDILNGIVALTDAGADAINMSFGGGGDSPLLDRGIDYAFQRGVVLAAAASNEHEAEQGAPAAQLQPGDAANIDAGRGLVVTGADLFDQNAQTGFGNQVSITAYGFFDAPGPPGIISTYPGNITPRDVGFPPPIGELCLTCRQPINGDNRYAYLQGTSMATPQVTAAAALLGALNPDLTAQEKIRILKQTARRSGGFNPELGWGILDAGKAVDVARRVDRTPPTSRAKAPKRVTLPRGAGAARSHKVELRFTGRDPRGHAGLIPSGLAGFDVYVRGPGSSSFKRVKRKTTKTKLKLKVSRTGSYRVFTRARDHAGNVEAAPAHADATIRVRRG
jgi:serine protease